MLHLETIPQSIKLLYDWVQENPANRHFTIAFVNDQWQVSVIELMKQSDDWDADAWVIRKDKAGGYLWQVVNDVLRAARDSRN
jgi:hypothetical protein